MAIAGLGYLLTLPKFDYLEARSVEEACSLLAEYRGKARPIAGGTDLLVSMKKREARPEYLINLKSIPDLNYISYAGESLTIGALTTMHDIESSSIIRQRFPALADAAHKLGSPHIRNVGTIGGNLCNASPAAETAPSLIGLGAKAKISGIKGERVVPLEEFFAGPGESVLQDGEMLTEIQVPVPSPDTRSVYLKLPARTAIDIAAVGVAVIITLDSQNKHIVDARVVLGAVAPTPIRARRAEDTMKGKAISRQLIEEASEAAAEESKPISDVRASASYRKEMVKVLTSRALNEAASLG